MVHPRYCLAQWAWLLGTLVLAGNVGAQSNCPVENCDSSVLSCAYINKQFRCKSCAPGFTVYNNGLSCVCPEGSFLATGGCAPCPSSYYCPLAQGMVPCPADLVTARVGAKSLNDCVNPPGYRYIPRGAGGIPGIAPCEADSYSIGYAKQLTCTACPSGFKTRPDNPPGSQTSPDICKAPPGYLMQGSSVVPCPLGSFRVGYGEALDTCTLCSASRGAGSTTSTTGATSVLDCTAVEPGYAALNKWGSIMWSSTADITMIGRVKLCPQNWYCPGGSLLPGASGIPVPCPGGLKTRQEGARDVSECLVPPGFRLKPGTNDTEACSSGNDTSPGEYKSTWDRATSCTPCGTGAWRSVERMTVWVYEPSTGNRVRSAALVKGLSTSCYLRKGMGALWTGFSGTTLQLQAFACPANFYGSSIATYGSKVKPCLPCPVNQVTVPGNDSFRNTLDFPVPTSVGFYSSSACVHQPGYGWINITWGAEPGIVNTATVAEPCLLDSWSAGGHNSSCTPCELNTYTLGPGSDNAAACNSSNLGPGQRMVAVQSTSDADAPGIYQSRDTGASFSGLEGSRGSWVSVASSSNSQFLVAARSGTDQQQTKVYVSYNYGRTWVAVGDVLWSDMKAVACSSTGQYMVAVGTDNVYISSSYGATWTAQNKAGAWADVAIDAAGSRIAAVQSGNDGGIAIASRSGGIWVWTQIYDMAVTDAGGAWSSVSLSSNGTLLAAVQSSASGGIYIGSCTNPNTCIWTITSSSAIDSISTPGRWSSVTMTADGTQLLLAQSAGADNGQILSGVYLNGSWEWTATGPQGHWVNIAASHNFDTRVAVDGGSGLMYISRNLGGWGLSGAPIGDWVGVALTP